VSGAKLNIWDEAWGLNADICPCDLHFIDWIDRQKLTDAVIFHFGTGAHHVVGIENARPDRRNAVLGITASPGELDDYTRLVINCPEVLTSYNVIFGDIYLLNERLLPQFDVVTLFHLCEFRTEQNDTYGALTDLEILQMLSRRTRLGGHILFYMQSFAFDRADHSAKEVIARWEEECEVERIGEFATLLVYRKH